MSVLIYVVYHDDRTEKIAQDIFAKYSWAQLTRISSTKYCESILFEYLLSHKQDWEKMEFVGLLTYNYLSKMKIKTLVDIVNDIVEGQRFRDHDLIAFRGLNEPIHTSHPRIDRCLKLLLEKLQLDGRCETLL